MDCSYGKLRMISSRRRKEPSYFFWDGDEGAARKGKKERKEMNGVGGNKGKCEEKKEEEKKDEEKKNEEKKDEEEKNEDRKDEDKRDEDRKDEDEDRKEGTNDQEKESPIKPPSLPDFTRFESNAPVIERKQTEQEIQEEKEREIVYGIDCDIWEQDEKELFISVDVEPASSIWKLKTLKSGLKLHNDGSATLAKALKKAHYVTQLSCVTLRIGSEGAASLASAINQHPSLTSLDLKSNDFGDAGLISLARSLITTQIIRLDVQGCEIGPKSLLPLAQSLPISHIRHLNLSWNQLGPEGAVNLATGLADSQIETLILSLNGIKSKGCVAVCEALYGSPTLTMLGLAWNDIGASGASAVINLIKSCTSLNSINLCHNSIGNKAGKSLIKVLDWNTTLTTLNLFKNGLDADLMEEINRCVEVPQLFPKLVEEPPKDGKIDLRGWKIDCQTASLLPFNTIWKNVTTIDFRRNPFLKSVPASLGYLDPSITTHIFFDPPDDWRGLEKVYGASKNSEDIISFAKSKLTGDLKPLNEMRLMVMGGAGVGKTTMIRCLRELSPTQPKNTWKIDLDRYRSSFGANSFNTLSTDGIDLGRLEVGSTTFVTWDFGGHKVYRITHQLFLSGYCIYAVLFRLTDPVRHSVGELSFWIRSLISKNATGAVVMVIGTHADRTPQFQRQRGTYPRGDSVHSSLRATFGDIIYEKWVPIRGTPDRFGAASAQNLRSVLKKVAERVELQVPAYLEVGRGAIEKLCQRVGPVASFPEVQNFLRSEGENAGIEALELEEKREEVLRVLDQLGVITLVKDKGELPMLVVLQPQWLSKLLSTFITTKQSFSTSRRGIVFVDVVLKQLWRDQCLFPKKYQQGMLLLLEQLSIIFPLRFSTTDAFFVPALLPETPPDGSLGAISSSGWNTRLRRLFVMEERVGVPVAVVPMVIVQMMELGVVEVCWQQGCVISFFPEGGKGKGKEGRGEGSACGMVRAVGNLCLELEVTAMKRDVGARWMGMLFKATQNMLTEFYNVMFTVIVGCPLGHFDVAMYEKGIARVSDQEEILPDFLNVSVYPLGFTCEEVVRWWWGYGGGKDCSPESCHFLLSDLYDMMVERRVSVQCTRGHSIRMDVLVPDFLFDSPLVLSWDSMKVGKELGRGAYGRVMAGEYTPQKPSVASPLLSASHRTPFGSNSLTDSKRSGTSHLSPLKTKITSTPLFFEALSPVPQGEEGEREVSLSSLQVAMKVLDRDLSEDDQTAGDLLKNLQVEVYAMSCVTHPNIVQLLGVCLPSPDPKADHEGKTAIVMELVGGGTLYDCINHLDLKVYLKLEKLADTIGEYHSAIALHQFAPAKNPRPPPIPPLNEIAGGVFEQIPGDFEAWRQRLDALPNHSESEIETIKQELVTKEKEVLGGIQSIHEAHVKESYTKVYNLSEEVSEMCCTHGKAILNMDWHLRLKIASDIISGIAFMHSLNPPLLHRDIKSPNIFLVRCPVGIDRTTDEFITSPLAKVGDLGLSVRLLGPDRVRVAEGHFLENLTATWAAPEVIGGQGYSTEADVYGVGIILWELLVQLHPFSQDLEQELMLSYYTQKGNRPSVPEEIERECPEAYLRLMRDCWDHVPEKRPRIHVVHQRLKKIMTELVPRMAELTPDAPLPSLPDPSFHSSPLSRDRGDDKEWEIKKIVLRKHSKGSQVILQQRSLEREKKVMCMTPVGSIVWIGFGDGSVAIYQDHPPSATLSPFTLETQSSGTSDSCSSSSSSPLSSRSSSSSSSPSPSIVPPRLSSAPPGFLACSQEESHKDSVTAIALQSSKWAIWSGAKDGSISVWRPAPQMLEDALEVCQIRGPVLLHWTRLRCTAREVWATLEGGRIAFYENREYGAELGSFVLTRETKVMKEGCGKSLLVVDEGEARKEVVMKFKPGCSPDIDAWLLVINQLLRSYTGTLIRVASVEADKWRRRESSGNIMEAEKGKEIVSLVPLYHSVWALTNSLRLVEWQLFSESNEHGLHHTQRIDPLRTVRVDVSGVETRFQSFVCGMKRLYNGQLCIFIGNSVIVVTPPDPRSPVFPQGSSSRISLSSDSPSQSPPGHPRSTLTQAFSQSLVKHSQSSQSSPQNHFFSLSSPLLPPSFSSSSRNSRNSRPSSDTKLPANTPSLNPSITPPRGSLSRTSMESLSPMNLEIPQFTWPLPPNLLSTHIRCFEIVDLDRGEQWGRGQETMDEKERKKFLGEEGRGGAVEVWAYDGTNIYIWEPDLNNPAGNPQLKEEIKVEGSFFLICLSQVFHNEVWGGTSDGGVVGWNIQTRERIGGLPLGKKEGEKEGEKVGEKEGGGEGEGEKEEEDRHQRRVTSLVSVVNSDGRDANRLCVFSGSTDETLRMMSQGSTAPLF